MQMLDHVKGSNGGKSILLISERIEIHDRGSAARRGLIEEAMPLLHRRAIQVTRTDLET